MASLAMAGAGGGGFELPSMPSLSSLPLERLRSLRKPAIISIEIAAGVAGIVMLHGPVASVFTHDSVAPLTQQAGQVSMPLASSDLSTNKIVVPSAPAVPRHAPRDPFAALVPP